MLIVRAFARKVIPRQPSTNVVIPDKPKPTVVKPKVSDLAIIYRRRINLIRLPDLFKSNAQTIFSQKKTKVIREYGRQIADAYRGMHSVEKPMDISRIQPLVNSSEIFTQRGTHHKHSYRVKANDKKMITEGGDSLVTRPLSAQPQKTRSLEYKSQHAFGYTVKRMPRTYGVLYRILNEVQARYPMQPLRALDYGSGTGSGVWALKENFPMLKQIVAIEPSNEMRLHGKRMTAGIDGVSWHESIAELPSVVTDMGLFDIVICSYVLAEVDGAYSRNLILEALWQRTKNVMIVAEHGTPKGSRLVYGFREWLLQNYDRNEANIIAPCPHEATCPLAGREDKWCHFSQFTEQYPKDIFPKHPKEKQYSNEKYSYLAACRGPTPRQTGKNDTLMEKSYFFDRVAFPVMKRGGHVIMDNCKANGEFERDIVTKSKWGKEVYKESGKLRWGDLWPYQKLK